jgi:hypothetical protein
MILEFKKWISKKILIYDFNLKIKKHLKINKGKFKIYLFFLMPVFQFFFQISVNFLLIALYSY